MLAGKRMVFLISALLVSAVAFWSWTPDRSSAELEARYATSPSQFVEVSGLRLHLRDTGPREAPALILLHGFGSSLHTWDGWSTLLEQRWRVIRFDLPGSALTGPDPTGDYTDRRSEQILLALMDQLNVDRATLVGNSIGGRIAWSFAAHHPSRVNRLVLVSPDGFASPGFEYGKAPHVPAVLQMMRYVLPKAVLRMNLVNAFADPNKLTESLLTRYDDLLRAPAVRQALLERMRQTVLVDPVPQLQQIECPTLLLWGQQDAMIPFANAQQYLANMPRARLFGLPGLGHVPQEEDAPNSVVPLMNFLDS